MRLKKKRSRRGIPWWFLVLCLALFSSGRAYASLSPAFWALAEMEARVRTTEIMSKAVTDHIARDPVVMHIEKDAQGRVTLVQPDVKIVNQLASTSALAIQQEMRSLSQGYIEMPLGLILGGYLFPGWGPRIRARLLQVGTVSVDVVEKFESAGINQTRYVISTRASTLVRIVTLLESRDIGVESSYPVAEVIFTGEVPDIMGFPK